MFREVQVSLAVFYTKYAAVLGAHRLRLPYSVPAALLQYSAGACACVIRRTGNVQRATCRQRAGTPCVPLVPARSQYEAKSQES